MVESDKLLLNSLKKSPKGLTAYQILNIVLKSKSIQPMTVYRALKNLTTNGLIHKTNKNKTFHLCDTAHVCNMTEAHEHNAVLAVCNDCGVAEELKADLFSKLIKNIKSKKRFNFNKFNLEITTTCKECN